MKKLSISLITLAISCPAMADINANAQSAKCDNGTLKTFEGSSNLQAQWNANTINLKWYNGEQEIQLSNDSTSKTCTYDRAIVLPEDPTKTGYEFNGWRVRRAAAAQCSLSGVDTSLSGTAGAFIGLDGTESTASEDESVSPEFKIPSAYNLSNNGEWAVEFDYGVIKGISRCSLVEATTKGQTGNPTDDLNQQGASYCWCQLTGYDENKDGEYCPISSLWTFDQAFMGMADYCAAACTSICWANVLMHKSSNVAFREALYGSVGQ